MAYLHPYCTGLWTWNADYVVVEMTTHDKDKIIAAAKEADSGFTGRARGDMK